MPAARPDPSHFEKTLLITAPRAGTAGSQPSHGPIEVVAAETGGLVSETQALLHSRLVAASWILFGAVGMFFVRSFLIPDAPARNIHGCVVVGMAIMIGVMRLKRCLSLTQLRWAELLLFGTTCVFLAAYEADLILIKAREHNPIAELAAVKSCVLYFFGVIMLYGTFIPNTWKRAACVVFPMALIPGSIAIIMQSRSRDVRAISSSFANFEQISDNVLMLTMGALASVYGTHIIYTLRQQAYKARQLGQYRLKRLLGSGGMGEVYLAEHQLLKRPCAIKLIRPDESRDPSALMRFEREVRATAKLTHWNTVEVFDYGRTEDGTFYYVMEYLPGLSLADLVKDYGPLQAGRAIHLLRQVCAALSEAHALGLVHRDIKPANIFAARLGGIDDVAKLLDFGLVKQTDGDPLQSAQKTPADVSGSPHYMSPEQAAAAERPDQRSDIYSLGATAYFLLTGRTPFQGASAVLVLLAHAKEALVPPSHWNHDIPADLERVILQCLEKDPHRRYPTAQSLRDALDGCTMTPRWTDADSQRWWSEVHLPSPVTSEFDTQTVLPETATTERQPVQA